MDKAHPYFNEHQTGYEQYIGEDPLEIEMQKLCFNIFIRSEEGQRLSIMLLEKYIMPGLYSPDHPQAPTLSLYFEGFREAFRGLMNMAKIHKKRIDENGSIGTAP